MNIKRAVVIGAVFAILSAGSAFAGRGGGGRGGGGGGGGRVVHGGGGGGHVVVRHTEPARGGPSYGHGGRVVVTRERYYDRTRQPALVVESYGRRPGYYWVPGNWDWDRSEWIWYPGHYDVDNAYQQVPVRVYGRY